MSISLGLENFHAKKPVSKTTVDGLSAGLEALESFSAIQQDLAHLSKLQSSVSDLVAIKKTISKCGIDKSIVRLFGKDLCSISTTLASKCEEVVEEVPAEGRTAPAEGTPVEGRAAPVEETVTRLIDEEAEVTPEEQAEVVEQVEVATESLWENIKTFLAKLWTKVIDWVKGLMANTEKLAAQLTDLAAKVDTAKATAEGTVFGYKKADFDKASSSTKDIMDMFDEKIVEKEKEVTDLTSGLNALERSSMTIKESGFTGSVVAKDAKEVAAILAKVSKDAEKSLKSEKAKADAELKKAESAEDKAAAQELVKESKLKIEVHTAALKAYTRMGVQLVRLCKAFAKEASKEPAK